MKPVLVLLPGLRGPAPQIWYPHSRGFVGCGDQKPIETVELPEGEWTIAAAMEFKRKAA